MNSLIDIIVEEIINSRFTHKINSNHNVITFQVKTPFDCNDRLNTIILEAESTYQSNSDITLTLQLPQLQSMQYSVDRITLLHSIKSLIDIPPIPSEYKVIMNITSNRECRYNIQLIISDISVIYSLSI